MHETARIISLKSNLPCNSNTSNIYPTSSILNERELFLRVEWNEIFRTRRDPFAPKKFSNLSPEILIEWITPLFSTERSTTKFSLCVRLKNTCYSKSWITSRVKSQILFGD